MIDTRINPLHCLHCGYEFDAATAFSDAVPKTGHLSVCIKCGAIMMFDDDLVRGGLTVRGLTEQEVAEITSDPKLMADLARMVKGVHFLNVQKHKRN